MKIRKGHIRWRLNKESLLIIISSILTIPLVIIMLDIFKPKTLYDFFRKGCIISNIRETIALRGFNPKLFLKGPLRHPYEFGNIYPEKPNTLVKDNGIEEEKVFSPEKSYTIDYIKQIGNMLLDFTPYYII